MVELVDTYALGAYALRCAGSNPVPGTRFSFVLKSVVYSVLRGSSFIRKPHFFIGNLLVRN